MSESLETTCEYARQDHVDIVVKKCLELFNSLPKKGKPSDGKEWTVLAGIVEHNATKNIYEVVALGTGTKCIGPSKMRKDGRILHDSHAEVIARRAFLRYIYHHLELVYKGEESPVLMPYHTETGLCSFRSNISYHFYISHTPCGDASIIQVLECDSLKNDVSTQNGFNLKRKISGINKIEDNILKCPRLDDDICVIDQSDIFRTGGKPVAGETEDPHLPGSSYHTLGSLRNKPGRGEATLSMSCSDKIAKWNVLGCLGALLNHYIPEPLYFTSIVTGKCPYSSKSMQRAVYDRISTLPLQRPFKIHSPKLLYSNIDFKHRIRSNSSPCGSAIIWSKVPENSFQVAAKGFKLGVTRKQLGTTSSQCAISKNALFKNFLKIKRLLPRYLEIHSALSQDDLNSYGSYKNSAYKYQEMWNILKTCVFKNWLCHDRELDEFVD